METHTTQRNETQKNTNALNRKTCPWTKHLSLRSSLSFPLTHSTLTSALHAFVCSPQLVIDTQDVYDVII